MSLNKLICHVKAIPSYVRHKFDRDFYNPHEFVEDKTYHSNIWITDKGFRLAKDSLHHYPGELFVANAKITEIVCAKCGKRVVGWEDGSSMIIEKE